YIAKNIVAAKLAEVCEIQLSYAIGVPEPISILVDCEGTGAVDEAVLVRAVRRLFPLTPREMIRRLKLLRPIYQETAHDGHFGRRGRNFTWERTDMVRPLRKACGL
ncbi:MAG: methionine adenosyltransferase domain-containing protein, partial [Phycisphaerae bacterium]|nr:methionine adenosyltransferase domain-containing protein [Phycisphaerae bacterium]